MDPALEELCAVLDLHPTGDGRFVGESMRLDGLRGAYGGQLLAQMVIAADRAVPAKTVKSLHATFVRPAAIEVPLAFHVDVMHAGRLFASATVSVAQEERLCARALVLLDAPDEELATHALPAPPAELPLPGTAGGQSRWGGETVVSGGVDVDDLAASGPPELLVWARFPGIPSDDGLHRALLAYASEPHFFGAALRPHAGLSPALAYTAIVPAVITHGVTYHARVRADQWMLLHVTSPHLGRGRIYGQADVFDGSGSLVASVSQENQLRPLRRS